MFRKPKRNIRQRKVVHSDEEDTDTKGEYHEETRKSSDIQSGVAEKNTGLLDDEDALNLKELQSNITKFKEGKSVKHKKGKVVKVVDKESASTAKLSAGNILSFEQELEGGE